MSVPEQFKLLQTLELTARDFGAKMEQLFSYLLFHIPND